MNFIYQGPTQTTDISILNRLLHFRGEIGCDVETISKDDQTPIGCAFAPNIGEAFYFPIDSPYFPWHLLRDPGITIIFHFAGFDVNVLENHNQVGITSVQDSCLAAQVLGMPGKLAELCLEMFNRPVRDIKELIGTGQAQIGMDKVPIEKVAERACLDARDALEVWQAIKHKVPKKAYDLEMRFMPVAMAMQNTGIRIDKAAVHVHRERIQREMQYLRLLCENQGFNPGSSQQLAAILESKGYKVIYNRETHKPKLDKNILSTFYSVEPLAVMTLKYRSLQTLLTHLIRPLDEGRYLVGDRVYPRVNLNVTRTGRISRSNPATQNINEGLRNIIIPNDGEIIHSWDFSQIELRWAAYLWDDTNMKGIFARNEDVHQSTAEGLIKDGMGGILGPDPKVQRDTGKTVNFTIMYLGGPDTLYKKQRIPKDQGARLIDGYFRLFPGIAKGIEDTKTFALENGYTETFYGRVREEIESLEYGKEYQKQAALRELVNHVIQGSAAETLKEAMIKDKDEPQFHTVHDEALLSAPADYVNPNLGYTSAPFDTPSEP